MVFSGRSSSLASASNVMSFVCAIVVKGVTEIVLFSMLSLAETMYWKSLPNLPLLSESLVTDAFADTMMLNLASSLLIFASPFLSVFTVNFSSVSQALLLLRSMQISAFAR